MPDNGSLDVTKVVWKDTDLTIGELIRIQRINAGQASLSEIAEVIASRSNLTLTALEMLSFDDFLSLTKICARKSALISIRMADDWQRKEQEDASEDGETPAVGHSAEQADGGRVKGEPDAN